MKKILVVEDDAKIAAALRIRLEAGGYQVVAAADGVIVIFNPLKPSPAVTTS